MNVLQKKKVLIMKELKCPKCGNVFKVDEADYAFIVSQVKTAEFEAEINRRLSELHERHKAEQELATAKTEQTFQSQLSKKELELGAKDAEIERLKSQLAQIEAQKETEMATALAAKDQEIAQLNSTIAQSDSKMHLAVMEERNKAQQTVQAKDNEIYPINMVEHIAHYSYVYEDDYKTTESRTTWRITDEEYKQKFIESYYADRYSKIEMVPGTEGYRYYVSLLKQNSWLGKARANFEIYKDEFINLTFMNSVWLRYVLTNSKSGSVSIGGASIDFAHTIPYIKKALAFVESREKEVMGYIMDLDPSIAKDPEWPVKLSEWMLEKDIHNFSEFRTKQFIKYLKENKTC